MKNVMIGTLMILSTSYAFASNCDDAMDTVIVQAKLIHEASDLASANDRLKIATELAKLQCKIEGIASLSNEKHIEIKP